MRKITASKLTDLLNRGFDGEVTFSGRVFGTIPPVEFGTYGSSFYESQGNFCLSQLDKKGSYSLVTLHGDSKKSTSLKFRLADEKMAEHSHPEKYGDIVSIPISFTPNAYLQIEPNEIKY